MNPSYIVIPLVALIVALIGGNITSAGMYWYETLTLPEIAPTGAIIGAVWTFIYITVTIAALLVWNRFPRDDKFWQIIGLFVINAALNAAWTFVFFGINALVTSIIIAVLLEVSVLLLLFKIRSVSRPTALLLYPYAVWVAFAIYLTIVISNFNL